MQNGKGNPRICSHVCTRHSCRLQIRTSQQAGRGSLAEELYTHIQTNPLKEKSNLGKLRSSRCHLLSITLAQAPGTLLVTEHEIQFGVILVTTQFQCSPKTPCVLFYDNLVIKLSLTVNLQVFESKIVEDTGIIPKARELEMTEGQVKVQ